MKLNIQILSAYGNEAEQSWYFIEDEESVNYKYRWIVVRKYCADGSTWWGIRANFPDTHEKAINDGRIIKEMKIAKEAITYLKKHWRKHLSF